MKRSNAISAIVFACLFCLLSVWAWSSMYAYFALHDDEGYVLYTVGQFLSGLRVYDEFFTQYGPFYYLYQFFLFRGTPLDLGHDAVRLFALCHWLGASWLAFLLARSLGQSLRVAWWSLVLVFVLLAVNIYEPGHPGGAISFFYVLGLCLVMMVKRSSLMMLGVSALIAFVVGMKINSGLFFALGAWSAFCLRRGASWRWLFLCWGSYFFFSAFLMRERLGDGGVLWFLVLLWLSAGAAMLLVLRQRGYVAVVGVGKYLGWVSGGVFALLGLGLWVMVAGGMVSWSGVWSGVIVQPLQLASSYEAPFVWTRWSYISVTLTVCALLYAICGRSTRRWEHGPIVLSLLCFVVAWYEKGFFLNWLAPLFLEILLPVSVLILALMGKEEERSVVLRYTAVYIFVLWGVLQAYPVPGSQIGWAVFPLALLWVRWLTLLSRLWRGERFRFSVGWATAVLLLGVVYAAQASWLAYRKNVPLGLLGADWIRLSRMQVADLRVMSDTVRQEGRLLLTVPGILSLNLFAEVDPPGPFVVTHWYSLLSEGQQSGLLDALQAEEEVLVVYSPLHISFLQANDLIPAENEVLDFVRGHFLTQFGNDNFALMTHSRLTSLFPMGTFVAKEDEAGSFLIRKRFRGQWQSLWAVGHRKGEAVRLPWRVQWIQHQLADAGKSQEEWLSLTDPEGVYEGIEINYFQFVDGEGREVDFVVPWSNYRRVSLLLEEG